MTDVTRQDQGTDRPGVIVGFNRRRDSYQAPLAFSEAGRLERFVTDYYHPDSWPRLPGLSTRSIAGLPSRLVTSTPSAFVRQMGWELDHRRRPAARFPSLQVDSAIGKQLAKVARARPECSLLIYSGYALEAFTQRANARRTLFQFHPTEAVIRESLAADDLADARPWMPEPEVAQHGISERSAAEVAGATAYVTASSITKRGLVIDGVDPRLVHVVPYGTDVDEAAPPPMRPLQRCRFLYVGQGLQRKGLHLLLQAWRDGRPAGAHLTVVALKMDPEIGAMLGPLDDVTVRPGVSRAELVAELDAADTLVLPSLLEGFGLVLLEALARGCRLIGSTCTGLPDLHLPDEVGSLVRAGSLDDLRAALARNAASFEPDRPYSSAAWQQARLHPWSRFRSELREVQDGVAP